MAQSDITRLLISLRNGDKDVEEKLYSLIYDHLRDIAKSQLLRELDEHTLSKTDLVHEAYIKLVRIKSIEWQDRGHFYAIASKAMRQILTDYARKKLAQKRGGRAKDVTLDEQTLQIKKQAEELVHIDEALKKLSELNERHTAIIELKFYGGLTMEETAKTLGISRSTANRDWQKARAWLYNQLSDSTSLK